MPDSDLRWQIQPAADLPAAFLQTVQRYADGVPGRYAAQLLWQRGIRDAEQLAGFLSPDRYQPTPASAFGQEMQWAVDRLRQARDQQERIAIWGDFDADGITATAVLWEGLGQFFAQSDRLVYTIPNRLTESHGLSIAGIEQLAQQNCRLIVTCDTGSTNLKEIEYAQSLAIDVIVTDHHTLPATRPPVAAIVNPRDLPSSHPLAHLSGVAVAYKLVEALYAALPAIPTRPLEALLDLVAIGLIADLVELKGDCRYLAQRGIERLQQQGDPRTATRPGIARLLELCKRNGDRPTDISFGLGPRINAISRIHGDARFGVELLTSTDPTRCRQLAEQTELANVRRKALQKEVAQQVIHQLGQLDLSTTSVIVLSDPQWSVGVLGLVAGQIAHQYGRPTILLCEEVSIGAQGSGSEDLGLPEGQPAIPLARGSARSLHPIDLYQLVQDQAHLLHSFGGHPLAAGLSLPVDNVPLFAAAINRQMREQQAIGGAVIQADLTVTVAELGKDLFRELKLLEPCGMGNPVPKLLIQNCWFARVVDRPIKDWRGNKVRYWKTEFDLCDDSGSFPGLWWEHRRQEIPEGYCDAIVELDFNTYQKRYEVRLLALRSRQVEQAIASLIPADWILDWRSETPQPLPASVLPVTQCPSSWDDLQGWLQRALQSRQKLAIAYPPPPTPPPSEVWQKLIGIAKHLSRTGQTATVQQIQEKLAVGDRALQIGLDSLQEVGFSVLTRAQRLQIKQTEEDVAEAAIVAARQPFLAAVQEEGFRRQYFYTVPLSTIQAVMQQLG